MPIKKPHTLRKLDETEAAQLDQNFDQLYKTKLESRSHRNSSGAQKSIYQVAEHGLVGFSATGSATVAKTFSLEESHNEIVFAQAHAFSTLVTAHITDVTGTSVTIECRTVSGTAAFSAVTTASITVAFQVIGSSP
jgi:hypothetical protein